MLLVKIEEIRTARRDLPFSIRRTPILPLSRDLAEVGSEKLFLKAENLQVTGAYGAYKVRAVGNSLLTFSSLERRLRNKRGAKF